MDILACIVELSSGLKLQFISIFLATLVAVLVCSFKFIVSPVLCKKLPPGSFRFPLIGKSISFARAQKQDRTPEWILNRIKKYGPMLKTSMLDLTGQARNRFAFSGGDNGISCNQPTSVVRVLGTTACLRCLGPDPSLLGVQCNYQLSKTRKRLMVCCQNGFTGATTIIQDRIGTQVDLGHDTNYSIFFGLPDSVEKDELLKDFSVTVKGVWAIPLDFPETIFNKAMQARRKDIE